MPSLHHLCGPQTLYAMVTTLSMQDAVLVTKYNGCMYRFRSLVSHMTPDTPMPLSTPHPKYAARMARAQAAKAAEGGDADGRTSGEAKEPSSGQSETFAAYYRCVLGPCCHSEPLLESH